MSKIIRQHTKLTEKEASQYGALVMEYNSLYGKYNSRSWKIAMENMRVFQNAGHGSTFEGFLAAKREVIEDVRNQIFSK